MQISSYQRQFSPSSALNAPAQSGVSNAAPFGGNTGEVLSKAGQQFANLENAMARTALELKAEREDAWVSSRTAELTEKINAYVFGDGQNPGVYGLEGEQAQGIVNRSKEDLTKMVTDYAKDAPSDQAVKAFNEKALGLKIQTQSQIARHELGELKKWRASAAGAEASALVRSIGANYTLEPERIEEEFSGKVEPVLTKIAGLKGVDAGELIIPIKEKLLAGVIEQNIAAKRMDSAKALFDRWKDKIGTTDVIQIEKAIQHQDLLDNSDRIAEEKYALLVAGQKTESELMKEIRDIEDPTLSRAVRSLFRSQAQQYRYDQSTIRSNAIYEAATQVESAPDLISARRTLDAMPENSETQRKAKTAAQAVYNRMASANGLNPLSDPASVYEVQEKIVAGQINRPDQIREYAGKIVKVDRDRLESYLDKAQVVHLDQMNRAFIRATGKAPGTLTDPEKKSQIEFVDFASKMVRETNKGADPEYTQKLADMWVMKGEAKDTGLFGMWDSDKTFEKAKAEGRLDVWMPEILDEPNRPDNTLVLTKARAKDFSAFMKLKYPAEWEAALDQAGGDQDEAVRYAWRDAILEQMGINRK